MTQKTKKPEIRFVGFTGDWEQKLLGEIIEERIDNTLDFENNPLYSLTIEKGVTPKTERYIRDFLIQKENELFKIVRPNEFVTNPMNLRFGALGYNQNAFNVSVSGYYDVFSIDNNACSSFWNSYFKTDSSLRYFDNVATGSLIEKRRVKFTTLRDLLFFMPLILEEKKRIGDLFSSLDCLITLQQRKVEKLQNVKKSMLEKMFPKAGSRIPEIRFAGFIGEWEQQKFSVIADTRRGLTYNPSSIRETGVRVLRSSNIADYQFIFGEDDVFVDPNAVNIPYLHNGDILITAANGSTKLVGKHAIVKDLPDNSAVHGGFMLIATAKNPEFVNALMSAPWYSGFISLYVAGGNGAIGNLNKSDLDNQDVLIPSEEEQVKIGYFFSSLDCLITLQQRKLEKLQNVKKAMLEKMFV